MRSKISSSHDFNIKELQTSPKLLKVSNFTNETIAGSYNRSLEFSLMFKTKSSLKNHI